MLLVDALAQLAGFSEERSVLQRVVILVESPTLTVCANDVSTWRAAVSVWKAAYVS